MNENNTALTVYDRFTDPLDAIEKLGDTFAKSGMFGCEKAEQGRVLALACLTERKAPFEILRTYHLIQGRLTMRSDAMLAEYHRRGGKVQWKRSDEKAALAVWSYAENEGVEIGFTIEDAQRAQLIRKDSGWTKFPDAMLRARCISKALRMIAPEVVAGVYLPDERPIEGEVEVSTAAPKPLLPTQQLAEALKTEPAPAKKAPPTLEAEVVTTPAKTEAKKPEAATVTPPTEPTKTEPAKADLGKLDELFAKLQPHAEKVTAWLTLKGWLTSDQVCDKTFAEVCQALKTVHIDKILAAPDRFIAACNR